MAALLRLTIPAMPPIPLFGGQEIVGGCIALTPEEIRTRMIARRDHLAERGCGPPPDPAALPSSAPEWRKRDQIQYEMNRHQEYLRLVAAVVELDDAILHDKDLEVTAVMFMFGRTELERWSGYPTLHGQFVWVECRACERQYTPEECATSDWSQVADPRAGIGGSCLACPAGHVIFARQTWVA
jgi:hypothetical protein